jgi:probable rRNA maturation factor
MKKNNRARTPRPTSDLRRLIRIRREPHLPQKVASAAVRRAVRCTLDQQAFRKSCSVSLLLGSDETLKALNGRFRGLARATDVLSFGSRAIDPEIGIVHLGEIAISLPRAAAQARTRGAPLEREVLLLAVHGTLHLLGHDHDTPIRKKRMWQAQRQILKEIISKIPCSR